VVDEGLGQLGLELSPSARRAIDDHVRLLLAWTGAINLTAIREPIEVARRHVLDSLSAVPALRELGADDVVDLGSGAGFPGLPIAAALPARALLVESVAKKAAFLDTAVRATGLSGTVRVVAERAEAVGRDPRQREAWAAVTARAVAPLAELVELAFPLLALGGCLVAWKRGVLADELAAAERAGRVLGVGEIRVVVAAPNGPSALAAHRLVLVPKVRPTPPIYPRDAAARRRRPW